MNFFDYGVLAVILILVFFALWYMKKHRGCHYGCKNCLNKECKKKL